MIIYIAGDARSGSTIVDRYAGQFSNVRSLGEVARLWDEGVPHEAPCSCGETPFTCVFWGEVLRALPFDRKQVEAMSIEVGSAARFRQWPKMRRGTSRRESLALELLGRTYSSIRLVAPEDLLVDSSKSPSYFRLLARSGVEDVRLLHLIRDPAGSIDSRRTPLKNPAARGSMDASFGTSSDLRTLFDWHLVNALVHVDATKVPYQTLNFNHFLAGGSRRLREALAGLGANVGAWKPDATEEHLIGGNPVRFEHPLPPLRPAPAVDLDAMHLQPGAKTALRIGRKIYRLGEPGDS